MQAKQLLRQCGWCGTEESLQLDTASLRQNLGEALLAAVRNATASSVVSGVVHQVAERLLVLIIPVRLCMRRPFGQCFEPSIRSDGG